MKVTLKKSFKNHPVGTELDVSPRVKKVLDDRGVLGKKKARKKEKSSPSTKALEKPTADKMVREGETKEETKEEGEESPSSS